MDRVTKLAKRRLLYLNGEPTRTHCIAYGTLLIARWQPGRRGVWERRMDTCEDVRIELF